MNMPLTPDMVSLMVVRHFGYTTRNINYDANLLYALLDFPLTSDQFEILSWQEVKIRLHP